MVVCLRDDRGGPCTRPGVHQAVWLQAHEAYVDISVLFELSDASSFGLQVSRIIARLAVPPFRIFLCVALFRDFFHVPSVSISEHYKYSYQVTTLVTSVAKQNVSFLIYEMSRSKNQLKYWFDS